MTSYTFHTLNVKVTNGYIKTLKDMQQLDLKRNKENIDFIGVSFTSQNLLNITVKNTGSYQVHLIWLGIFDEAANTQDYYKIEYYINPAETASDIHNDTVPTFEGQERVIQLVTELGNTFSYSYPEVTLGDGGQAIISITGISGNTAYNPSECNPLGLTENVSGPISNLASNDSNYTVFHSYTSSSNDVNTTLLDDGFEGTPWDDNWDSVSSSWYQSSGQNHSGSYSAGSSDLFEGDFVCNDLEAIDADAIYIDFWYRLSNTEPSDLRLYYYDGSSYVQISTLGGDTEDTWLHYTEKVTDNRYFVSNFRIRFRSSLRSGEDVWIDDVSIKKQVGLEEQTAEVEFTGSSNLEDWSRLDMQVDSCWDIGEVTVTIQFYNYTLGDYAPGGNGYINYVSDAVPETDELKSQTITLDPTDFRNSTGHWKAKVRGVKSTGTQFEMKVDWIAFQPTYSSSGDSIPYNAWQEYAIEATADGDPIPYAYISIYANGTDLVFRNAITEESVSNPDWVYLNAEGEYNLEIKSTHGSTETFVLYVVAGSVVGQKTITQEEPG